MNEARNKTKLDRIAAGRENDRNFCRRFLGSDIRRSAGRDNNRHVLLDKIIHEGRILLSGEPKELVQSAEARRLYLGEGFRL